MTPGIQYFYYEKPALKGGWVPEVAQHDPRQKTVTGKKIEHRNLHVVPGYARDLSLRVLQDMMPGGKFNSWLAEIRQLDRAAGISGGTR